MIDLLDKIHHSDCVELIERLPDESVHSVVTDIPYGISLDDWDVLHSNTNSALLGQSPAQIGKSAFKRRGKPIRGWSSADKKIPKEYQEWCSTWAKPLFQKVKKGGSVFIFGARRTIHRALIALEDEGFLVKDILAWEKPSAHHRAQRISIVLNRRGLESAAEDWEGWRLGNLAPIWEPVAWLFKPYDHTVTDNVLEHDLGAVNMEVIRRNGDSPTNLLRASLEEERLHEAQKPVDLVRQLIELTTRKGHVVLDPFCGSGTTAIAAIRSGRNFVCGDSKPEYVELSRNRIDKEKIQAQNPKQIRLSLFDSAQA